jgi:hypothetical protein
MTTIVEREFALIDLIDRLLGGGVVIFGDITLAAADVDLVYVGLRALVASVATAQEKGDAAGDGQRAVIQLYAITDHPGPPLPDVAPLRLVARRALAAVCAPVMEGEVTAELLWRHERVVEALMDDRDVLPVRYGTHVRDDEAAAQALEANHDELVESLELVRGAVELSVRVLAAGGGASPAPPRVGPGQAGSGVEYLRVRGRQVAAQADVARAVHEPLCTLARAQMVRPASLPGEMLRAAYLVKQDQVGRFSERVGALQDENPSLRLVCTGPWPVYSFAQR